MDIFVKSKIGKICERSESGRRVGILLRKREIDFWPYSCNIRNMEKNEGNRNDLCFACGPANPIGLKLIFRYEDGKARSEFIPGPYHQSWDGVFHGGLLALCLDEAFGYALFFLGIKGMTAKMDLRIRRTVRPGEKIFLTGEIRRKTRKIIETYAKAELEDGTLAAEGTASMFVIEEKMG
jgi:acyl-coenzyme A thioesterase PaaI-like protein